jgi:hypothetical protein
MPLAEHRAVRGRFLAKANALAYAAASKFDTAVIV